MCLRGLARLLEAGGDVLSSQVASGHFPFWSWACLPSCCTHPLTSGRLSPLSLLFITWNALPQPDHSISKGLSQCWELSCPSAGYLFSSN